MNGFIFSFAYMHKYTGLPIDAVIGKPVRRTGLWRVPLTRLANATEQAPLAD